MAVDEIPEDVRRLLSDHVESYEQLEVLVLLRKQPDRTFSPEAVAAALNLHVGLVDTALNELCRRGFVEAPAPGTSPEWRYRPSDPSIDATTERLVHSYGDRSIEIVKLMNANAIERVRTSAIRAFANAFLFGRTKKSG